MEKNQPTEAEICGQIVSTFVPILEANQLSSDSTEDKLLNLSKIAAAHGGTVAAKYIKEQVDSANQVGILPMGLTFIAAPAVACVLTQGKFLTDTLEFFITPEPQLLIRLGGLLGVAFICNVIGSELSSLAMNNVMKNIIALGDTNN